MFWWTAITLALASPPTPAPGAGGCVDGVARHQLQLRNLRGGGRLLELFPGGWAASHQGRGGARDLLFDGHAGFHTRDTAVLLEGVALNQRAHVHAAGWANLDLLPTVLVASAEPCRGAARADTGAFATAGSLHLHTSAPHTGFRLIFGGGTDGSGLARFTWRPREDDDLTFAHAEIEGGEGVGGSRSWRHLRAAGSYAGGVGAVELRAMAFLQDSAWDHPGPLRLEDVGQTETFYGAYDLTGGAISRDLLLIGKIERPWDWGSLRGTTWLRGRHLRLRETFTGYLVNPAVGDLQQQRSTGGEAGLDLRLDRTWHRPGPDHHLAGGVVVDGGSDGIDTTWVDQAGTPWSELLEASVRQTHVGTWVEAGLGLGQVGQLRLGGRADRYDLITLAAEADDVRASGWGLSPKASLVLEPSPRVAIDAGYGRGHHPPELGDEGLLTLSQIDDAQLGLTLAPLPRVAVRLHTKAAFGQHERLRDPYDQRLLYVGRTRRLVVDGQLHAQLGHDLHLEGLLSWTDARRLDDDGALVWWVPRWTGGAVLATTDRGIGPTTASARLGVLGIGRRPLPGGFTDKPGVRTRASVRVDWTRWRFEVEVDNPLPLRVREAAWVGRSTYDPNAPASDALVRHVIGGEPFTLRLMIGVGF